jgi:hypothetical protein
VAATLADNIVDDIISRPTCRIFAADDIMGIGLRRKKHFDQGQPLVSDSIEVTVRDTRERYVQKLLAGIFFDFFFGKLEVSSAYGTAQVRVDVFSECFRPSKMARVDQISRETGLRMS